MAGGSFLSSAIDFLSRSAVARLAEKASYDRWRPAIGTDAPTTSLNRCSSAGVMFGHRTLVTLMVAEGDLVGCLVHVGHGREPEGAEHGRLLARSRQPDSRAPRHGVPLERFELGW